MTTDLPYPIHARGKVRDVYDLGDALLMIATDRISAFDHVLSPGIPGKGIILTQLSNFWFRRFAHIPNHLLETNLDDFPAGLRERTELAGRSVIVEKLEVIPIECVARGYLIGSGWSDYQKTGMVCGNALPGGLELGDSLPEAIFTPATKAETGHDENISFGRAEEIAGSRTASRMRDLTLAIYEEASVFAASRGIIIADTKIELGRRKGSEELVWIDEALTPDSSRFWELSEHRAGASPASFDKQFVRDHLEATDWDKGSEPPELPEQIVRGTLSRYLEAYERLTGDKGLRGGTLSNW